MNGGILPNLEDMLKMLTNFSLVEKMCEILAHNEALREKFEVLKKAKASPKDYPNLQVRLCGWNVLFSSLSEKEQDEFIARSNR